ncbi:DUF4124 domain-containing protein [Microbulbifer sediminum]|uniref:DUF4124 domain-containing protein n=1 Tax=Microbulbifer sediminum TaxID=2904250 RepID=UPI001F3C9999|nr:DUF4124 domain-containing protein [Microbulbifer sediminum]
MTTPSPAWLSAVLAALLTGSAATADNLYRWVDEDGNIHFGDRPPQQAEAEDLSGKLAPVNSADATGSRPSSHTSQPSPQRQYNESQRRLRLQEQQQRRRACALARKRLRILQGPVALVDGNGEEIRMSERERQRRAAAMEREISRLCGQ